jgi:hypothetical protein
VWAQESGCNLNADLQTQVYVVGSTSCAVEGSGGHMELGTVALTSGKRSKTSCI